MKKLIITLLLITQLIPVAHAEYLVDMYQPEQFEVMLREADRGNFYNYYRVDCDDPDAVRKGLERTKNLPRRTVSGETRCDNTRLGYSLWMFTLYSYYVDPYTLDWFIYKLLTETEVGQRITHIVLALNKYESE